MRMWLKHPESGQVFESEGEDLRIQLQRGCVEIDPVEEAQAELDRINREAETPTGSVAIVLSIQTEETARQLEELRQRAEEAERGNVGTGTESNPFVGTEGFARAMAEGIPVGGGHWVPSSTTKPPAPVAAPQKRPTKRKQKSA